MIWETWKKGFNGWENATAQWAETCLKSPWVLEPAAALLTAMMKVSAAKQKAVSACWTAVGLPTRQDQERTLHAVNQLESRLYDLEERLSERK